MGKVPELPLGVDGRTSAMASDYKVPNIVPNIPAMAVPAAPLPPAAPTTQAGVAGLAAGSARKKSSSRQPLSFEGVLRIGRFEMIREIARGGMGQVFLARDTKLGRKVAIKFLLNDDPSFVARFMIEARATARCEHENIVAIYEVDEHEGLPFMVLEYLEGKTLTQILETKQTARQISELMIAVVRALERAHEHGIVHRDLKPSNIFVTERGVVKVLDFGVAKLFETNSGEGEFPEHITGASNVEGTQPGVPVRTGTSSGSFANRQPLSSRANSEITPAPKSGTMTGTDAYVTFSANGALVGTLPYMSPEQWGADAVDHTSDIWAVGIMFWRALLSIHPAGSMSPDKLKARLLDVGTPLTSIGVRDPSLPKTLVRIVDKCLAKQKSQRYQSATELLSDLVAFNAPSTERGEDYCPYRGLAAFGENDAKYFFGRSAEIRTAVSQLDAWPLLAVVGPSGVGKSSFVHAGVVPAVRQTAGGQWDVKVIRPGRSPLSSLAAALSDFSDDPGRVTQLLTQLSDSPGLFGVELRAHAKKSRQHVLLVVDQLEELFTLCDNENEQKTFLAALLAAADDPSAPVRVVMSMRADFLDRLAGHKYFLAELSRGLFFLSAPDTDNLRDALVRPAEIAGYSFEDTAIPDEMLASIHGSRGALPLLQFAASKLWDSRNRERKILSRAAYQAMGGVGGAFSRHADEVVAAIPPSSQPMLRAVLTRLVTPEGTRAIIDRQELVSLSKEPGEIGRIIDHLVRARLIASMTDASAGSSVETVEIVHEALITEWPTLKRWLEDSQSLRGFLHELGNASKQWAARNRESGLLWRGETATEALSVSQKHVLDLSSTERDFLLAVADQSKKAKTRRAATLAAVFATLGLIIVGGSIAVLRIRAANKDAQEKAVIAVAAAEQAKAAQGKATAALQQSETDRKKAEKAQTEAEIALAKFTDSQAQLGEEKTKVADANENLEQANERLKREASTALAAKKQAEIEKKAAEAAKAEAVAAKSDLASRLKQEQAANAKLQARLGDLPTCLTCKN
jgi:eukaryotic-like serine/threonine-protein kinase